MTSLFLLRLTFTILILTAVSFAIKEWHGNTPIGRSALRMTLAGLGLFILCVLVRLWI